MLVSVKTLQQKTFQVEVEPTTLISDLKKKIEASEGFEAGLQKLIFSGKILEDSKTVESYGISEKGFIVVMVNKPKTAAPAPTPAPVAAAAAPKPAAPAPTPAPAAAAPSGPAATPASAFASLATGAEYENAVNNLVEMGFDKEQVKAAMRAAFNNPDRAAEYLMTGNIPQHAFAPEPAAPTPAAPAQAAAQGNLFQAAAQAARQPAAPAAPATTPEASGMLNYLRQSPQLQQLRQLVQTQPELIGPLLQQLAASNPQIGALIAQNQDAVLQLLLEGATMEGDDEGEGEGDDEGGENVQYIQLTPDENAAIERLVALGFDRNMVIEAYFACDKNEEMAANFLFDQMQGDFQ